MRFEIAFELWTVKCQLFSFKFYFIGREFQARGPVTENKRSPSVRWDMVTDNDDWRNEVSVALDRRGTETYDVMLLCRYRMELSHQRLGQHAKRHSLKLIFLWGEHSTDRWWNVITWRIKWLPNEQNSVMEATIVPLPKVVLDCLNSKWRTINRKYTLSRHWNGIRRSPKSSVHFRLSPSH